MKKILTVAAVLLMLLMLVSCGGEDTQTAEQTITEEPEVTEETVTEEPEETPVEEVPEEEPVEETPVEETPVEEVPEEEPVVEQEEVPSTVDLAAVSADMTSQMGIAASFPLDTASLLGLYGITEDCVKQSSGFVTMSGTFPDEIVMVEAVDAAAADTVQACLQTRLDAVLVQSQSYDAENYAAAQECCVRRNGLFVSLILSPKQAELAAIYGAYIG